MHNGTEGELDVLVNEFNTMTFLRNEGEGQVTRVLLNEKDALKYAGYQLRLRVNDEEEDDSFLQSSRRMMQEGSNSNTGSGNNSTSTRVLARSAAPVQAVIEKVYGPAGRSDVAKDSMIGPNNVSSVVFLVSYCGMTPAINASTFRRIYLNGPNGTNETAQNWLEWCSQGAARMPSELQRIYDVKVCLIPIHKMTDTIFGQMNMTDAGQKFWRLGTSHAFR